MPLELTVQVDDEHRIVAHCGAEPLTTPTPLADLRLITADSNPYQFAPEPLGKLLFAALGGSTLLERLAATDDRLLLLNTDKRAATVPWEYAHTGSEFLACEFALLRLLPTIVPVPPRGGGVLNFIALAADPLVDDQGNPYRGLRLDVENELQKISATLRQSNVALTAQRVPPLLSHLQRALRAGPALLHLSCHGTTQRISEYGVEKEVAFLALEDANGKLRQVRGEQLVNLAARGILRLVVLSACQSALSSQDRTTETPIQGEQTMARADANLARALVQQGLPAAIGMQGNFPDALSDEFATTLYDSLLAGSDLGEALRQARLRLRWSSPHAVGLPVAYVAPEGWTALPLQVGHPQVRNMTPARYTNLPNSLRPPAKVVGRERELHQLALAFKSGQEDLAAERQGTQVVTVVGTGGIGKTTLAASFVARFGWRWPGGVIGVSLADLPTLRAESVLLILLERLGIDTRSVAHLPATALAELLQQSSQERQCLLLIDNYENVLELLRVPSTGTRDSKPDDSTPAGSAPIADITHSDITHAQTLHHLLALLAQQGISYLLTSRQQPAGFVGEMLFPTPNQPLEGLDVAAGAELFFANCPSAIRDRRQYTSLARQVATVTEGHPLAIALLGGEYETSRDSVSTTQFLAQWDLELAAAYRPGLAAHHIKFEVAFERSFRHLNAEQQRQLLALSRFPAPFFAEGAALVWGAPLAAEVSTPATQLEHMRTVLGGFVQRSLLKVEGRFEDSNLPATYRLEPVIQGELRRRAATTTDPAIEQGYTAYAVWLVNRAYGATGSDVGIARLVQQWLDELVTLCHQQIDQHKARYCWMLGVLLRQFGRIAESLTVLAEGEATATAINDQPHLARILHAKAEGLVILGDLEQALTLFTQCAQLNEQEDAQGERAANLHAMAQVFLTRGDLERALQLYEESLVLLEKLGDIQGKAASLSMMAQVFLTRGDLERALQLYEESLVLKEKLGDIQGKAASLHNMAQVFLTRGDLERALQLYEESLVLKEKLGDIQGKAASLSGLANVQMARSDWVQAHRLVQSALALEQQLNNPAGVAFNLVKLGQVALARGEGATARHYYEQGLALFTRLGMPQANQVRAMLTALDDPDDEQTTAFTPQQALLALLGAAAAAQHPPASVAAAAEQLAATPDLPPTVADVATALGVALRTPQPATWGTLQRAADRLLQAETEFLAQNALFSFLFALARLFDRYDQPDAAVHFQAQAVAQLSLAGDDQNAQEGLSIALYNHAGYLAQADRLDEAVAALEAVVTIDERFGLADLESDRQALVAMRLRQANGALSAVAQADEQSSTAMLPAALTAQLEAQMANLAPAEATQMRQALAALARLSPDEQEAVLLAQQQAQIDRLAQQTVDAALAAMRNDQVAELLPQLEAAAVHFAADEAIDSAYAQLAHFIRAIAAALQGIPVPAIPAAHAERWLAFQQALANHY